MQRWICHSGAGKLLGSALRNMAPPIASSSLACSRYIFCKASMNDSKLDAVFRPFAKRLHANHMSRLGIANTMRLAYTYNRLKFGRQDDWRRALYQTQLSTLLEENGGLSRPPIEIKDGWALDTSMSLRSEEHTSELQSRGHLVCRLL